LVVVLPLGLMAFACGVCPVLYRAWSPRD